MQTRSDRKSMMVSVCVYVLRAIFIHFNIGSMAERRMSAWVDIKTRETIVSLLYYSNSMAFE